MSLTGKTSIITGGSDGIGRAIAAKLASEGAHVVICARNAEKLESVAVGIRAAGGSVETRVQDVADTDSFAAMIVDVASSNGLDILVNNAAHVGFGSVADASLEDFRENFRVNVDATYAGMQAAIKAMSDNGGSIINISSINGDRAMPGMAGYSSSKAALLHLTRLASMETAGQNIRVNAVTPGPIMTPGTEAFIQSDPKAGEAIAAGIPMQRMGRPEEVANVVLFLASDMSSYVTGANIPVDGGKANELAVNQG